MSRAVPHAMACVYVPALALQVAHRQGELTATAPGVVCDGVFVADANRAARAAGIQIGMRLAQARTLVPGLHTATVSDAALQQTMQDLWQHLLHFSPAIEIDSQHPGLLWIDPNGLQHLFGTHAQWGEAIRTHLRAQRYHVNIVVGFNRYLSFALARRHGCFVCTDAAHEKATAHAMVLHAVPMPAEVREALVLLGVATLGDFLRMPVDEVRQCLGDAAEHIHRLAHNQVWKPLTPQKWMAPQICEQALEPPDADAHRLLFVIKGMLRPLLDKLQKSCQACAGVHIHFKLDNKQDLFEQVAPAQPTLDERALTELLRLRLEHLVLAHPVACVIVRLEGRVMRPEQMLMLQQKPKRDVRAATWALAKIRALMGEGAVTRACLCDSHLPELSFRWELLSQVVLPQVQATDLATFPLVRAVHRVRTPLPAPPKRNIHTWLRHDGRIESMHGPFRLHSAWWHKTTERDYYYIQTDMHNIVWVYYSRMEKRWFRQGYVD